MWKALVDSYRLEPHPEGGFFRETYRAEQKIVKEGTTYSAATAIYFLLVEGAPSRFHRIGADEMWHFYMGSALLINELTPAGVYRQHRLGSQWAERERFQLFIPAGSWFAAETLGAFSFVGCTVAPGFVFSEFELAERAALAREYPRHRALIERLT